jgi:hypothetical protein
MSAAAAQDKPRGFAYVPGFPDLEVHYQAYQSGMCYCGTAEDLIAAGVATASMLAINPPIGKRARRVDPDGDAFHLKRYWRSSKGGYECPPYRYFQLIRLKPESRAAELPGAHQAVAAYNELESWWAEKRGRSETVAPVRLPPNLRLVVDNTKGTAPRPHPK